MRELRGMDELELFGPQDAPTEVAPEGEGDDGFAEVGSRQYERTKARLAAMRLDPMHVRQLLGSYEARLHARAAELGVSAEDAVASDRMAQFLQQRIDRMHRML